MLMAACVDAGVNVPRWKEQQASGQTKTTTSLTDGGTPNLRRTRLGLPTFQIRGEGRCKPAPSSPNSFAG